MGSFANFANVIGEEDVVKQALKSNPDEALVRSWYQKCGLAIFNGMTPCTLVERGYGQDLIHYISKVKINFSVDQVPIFCQTPQ